MVFNSRPKYTIHFSGLRASGTKLTLDRETLPGWVMVGNPEMLFGAV